MPELVKGVHSVCPPVQISSVLKKPGFSLLFLGIFATYDTGRSLRRKMKVIRIPGPR